MQRCKSKKINIVGLILLFAGTVVAGCILSLIYLRLNPIISGFEVKLGILLAVAFGMGAGVVSAQMIKHFKVHNPKLAMAAVILGCLIFSYFKWAVYVSGDQMEQWLHMLAYGGNDGYQAPNAMWYMARPAELFKSIARINEEGRWSISTRTSNTDTYYTGAVLALVWIMEFVLICLPAIGIALTRATHPFIESENKWAVKEPGNSALHFGKELKAHKKQLKRNPEIIFDVPPIPVNGTTHDYCAVDFYHSSDYSENYITIKSMTYNNSSKLYVPSVLANNVKVDKEFLFRLHQYCSVEPPFDASEFEPVVEEVQEEQEVPAVEEEQEVEEVAE